MQRPRAVSASSESESESADRVPVQWLAAPAATKREGTVHRPRGRADDDTDLSLTGCVQLSLTSPQRAGAPPAAPWEAATRVDEFAALRKRWYEPADSYPLLIVLDDQGAKVEEMKEAIDRLTAAGVEPAVAAWFKGLRAGVSGG